MERKEKACCVFGHRKVAEKDRLKYKLTEVFENLIVNEADDNYKILQKKSLSGSFNFF